MLRKIALLFIYDIPFLVSNVCHEARLQPVASMTLFGICYYLLFCRVLYSASVIQVR